MEVTFLGSPVSYHLLLCRVSPYSVWGIEGFTP